MTLSMIVSFRNMDSDRVKKSLDSLLIQTCHAFKMIFVDYGSNKSISSSIQTLLSNYPFCTYYYSDTRGWLWNRSAALNTGAKLATTKYIFLSDVDIVYDRYFVEETLNQMQEDIFLVSDTLRVPQGFGYWSKLINGENNYNFKSMQGRGIACFTKKHFDEIGGLDENYVYWGFEDYDITTRMACLGIKQVISEKIKTYHQWHPRSSSEIPYSLLFHNTAHFYRQSNENVIYANKSVVWGRLISSSQRPVYRYVDPDTRKLISAENVVVKEAYNISGLQKFVKEIESLKNIAIVVSQNSVDDRLTQLANKILRRLNWKLDRKVTLLDDFTQGMIHAVPGLFEDYFLGCQIGNKIHSIFLKK